LREGEPKEVYRKLSRVLKEPYSLAPLLMTSGLLISAILTLGSPSLLAEILLITALCVAILGGLAELYYMILLSWASNAIRGGGPSFKDILYALISIGFYYTLIGIVMLSRMVNSYSKTLSCNCSSNTLYSLITLGVYLSKSQRCLSLCASVKMEELASIQEEVTIEERELVKVAFKELSS